MKKQLILLFCTIIMLLLVFAFKAINNEIHLVAVGDIMLARGVEKRIEKEGLNYPFVHTKEFLLKKDIVLGNLENPIYSGNSPVYKKSNLVFKAKSENAAMLKEAGFTILNLANNHTMDHKEAGLINTMKILHDNGISYIGAGIYNDKATSPLVIEKKGCKIGFLGYSMLGSEDNIYSNNQADIYKVTAEINNEILEAKLKCDFLVVTVHWGNEYDFYPSEKQKKLAYQIINSGADLILGHHPHVLQGIEQYKDKYIFYSLGNFVFDKQIQKGTDESIILNLVIKNKQVAKINIIPIKIVDCQPTLATGEVASYVLKRLQKYSQGMNIDIQVNNGIGQVVP